MITTASPQRVFELLSDAPSWPTWFQAIRRVDWVQVGDDGRKGSVGSVRRVWIGPITVEEHILESIPPNHQAYGIRSTIPVNDHKAEVWLGDIDGGTSIYWTTSFAPKIPGTGHLVMIGLRQGVKRLARALVAAAES
jgi:hypothetical protein